MIRGFRFLNYLCLSFIFGCTTVSKAPTPETEHTRKELEQGVEFRHPDDKDIRIRIMPGDPSSPHLNSRRPYVRQSAVKTNFDRYGNIVNRESDASHIPLDEYQFVEFWKNHEKK